MDATNPPDQSGKWQQSLTKVRLLESPTAHSVTRSVSRAFFVLGLILMNELKQIKFMILEHREPITFSHYEIHPLLVKQQPKNHKERRNEKDD